jgi:hypothetical protein
MKKYLTMRNLLNFMALISFGFCLSFGVSKTYQPMWMAFLACGIFLFFANLERVLRLKVGPSGFEAETRAVVNEAKNTIKELQDLSKIMASSVLGLVKRTGRMGGYSYDDKEKIKGSTLDVLRNLGVSEEEIERVVIESKWHQFVEFDFTHGILGSSRIPKDLPAQYILEWQELCRRGLDNNPAPEELSQFLRKCGLLTLEARELIMDYEHYIEHREQRRPDIWKDRGNWSHLQRQDK